jgi:glycosyltransferase involved in cell wall biosynthesis
MAAVGDPQAPRILFFGTIRPYKGFDLLIAACLSLWSAGAGIRAGGGGQAVHGH